MTKFSCKALCGQKKVLRFAAENRRYCMRFEEKKNLIWILFLVCQVKCAELYDAGTHAV